ncbi:MAG: hypothetical protein ABFR32_01510 [Bacteroidota bacterium]
MRTREFFMRLGVLLPMAFWGVFIVLMILGIVTYNFGADSLFYCDVYCKIGVTLLAAVFLSVIYCQARSCWKLK